MSRVTGTTLVGIDGIPIEVEVRISSQLPRVDIVGLPEAAVRESSARVRAAIASSGQRFPDRRITINLAPAELRKSGAGLDLPIAVGILAAGGILSGEALAHCAFFGELALDGRLRPIRGALAQALAARDAGCRWALVPDQNADEAALAPGIEVLAARTLTEVCEHLLGASRLSRAEAPPLSAGTAGAADLSEVRGQEGAKRALEIAAAGGHALLLVGPPGSGKTMLARRLPGLLPPMRFEEALETTRIHTASHHTGMRDGIAAERPFRAPHHSASAAGLMGGGNPPRPGEISLAHRGVLFLDEVLEFGRRSLEGLRQVLETRNIVISRANYSCVFPAHFMLVLAANPCPCGWFRSDRRDCACDPRAISRYRERLSGPLRDRIDIQASLSAVPWKELEDSAAGEGSQAVRERVVHARNRQEQRAVSSNAEIPDRQLDAAVNATAEARQLLGRAVDRLGLSARGARRTLRVARTIADLAASETVAAPAVAEALQLRTDEVE